MKKDKTDKKNESENRNTKELSDSKDIKKEEINLSGSLAKLENEKDETFNFGNTKYITLNLGNADTSVLSASENPYRISSVIDPLSYRNEINYGKILTSPYDKDIGVIHSGGILNENINVGTERAPQLGYYHSLIQNSERISIIESTQILEDETNKLKKKQLDLLKSLEKEQEKSKQKEKEASKLQEDLKDLEKVNNELVRKDNLGALIEQVCDKAKKKLLSTDKFFNLFSESHNCKAFILAIDIRRSTELMLKARSPNLFESFIINLYDKLSAIIKRNFGVVDKFTGDGILAFFPDFYSGEDYGLMSMKAAFECHRMFFDFYKNNRSCFISILKDVGLGIGIDFGDSYLIKMNKSYTLIGAPVVYACRMSSVEAGKTLLNQHAFEILAKNYSDYLKFSETTIMVKNEGETIGYEVYPSEVPISFDDPNWDNLIERYNQAKDNQ